MMRAPLRRLLYPPPLLPVLRQPLAPAVPALRVVAATAPGRTIQSSLPLRTVFQHQQHCRHSTAIEYPEPQQLQQYPEPQQLRQYPEPQQLRQYPELQLREAIFLAGMPGSGKSRVISQRYGSRLVGSPGACLAAEERAQQLAGSSAGYYDDDDGSRTKVLDLDREMIAHPLYSPNDPAAIYDVEGAYHWADEKVEAQFHEALADESITRIIIDGTGTKLARRAQRMQAARAAGLYVKLLYVKVSLRTAQRRNAKRSRVVPLSILQRYEQRLEEAIEVGRDDADVVEIVDNDVDTPSA